LISNAKLKNPGPKALWTEVRQFPFKLSSYISYHWNPALFVLSIVFSIGAFVVYWSYFDILSPFIPGGSVRASYGVFFVVPVILLVSAQTLFTTWLAHIAVSTGSPGKGDALKAYLVASVEVFLFSIYYVIFPTWGPYTFVVYFTPVRVFGPDALPIVIVWTIFSILVTYVLLRRVFRLESTPRFGPVRILLLAATMLAMMMVTAS
jgi:hypothetical protein